MRPGMPDIPPFKTDVSMNSFVNMNGACCWDSVPRKILSSAFKRDILLNCLILMKFSSFGNHTPSENFHCSAAATLCDDSFNSLHSWCRISGQRLWIFSGILFGPGTEADLAHLITFWTSLQLGAFILNSSFGPSELIRDLIGRSSFSCLVYSVIVLCVYRALKQDLQGGVLVV